MAYFRFEVRRGAEVLTIEEGDLPNIAAARRRAIWFAMVVTADCETVTPSVLNWMVNVTDQVGAPVLRLTMTSC